ncbi:MAG: UDP-2,3-diacylglucosamine diphosphatase [Burkholderiaceae bacterium]
MPTLPAFHELVAASAWQRIDFISDLHLQESERANFVAFARYLQSTPAEAIFILGDLFEVWVGDDVLGDSASFEARCCNALRACAQKKTIFFIHGNRDFLVGSACLQASGMQALPDPTVLTVDSTRYLLSHGDALCLADADYQQFRTQVRTRAWQQQFLAQPLPERIAQARAMRAHSEARKQQNTTWIDLDPNETQRWMQVAAAQHMVHGHTHEGVDHVFASAANAPKNAASCTRHVLCDWHADANPSRAQVLRLSRQPAPQAGAAALHLQRLPV